MTLDSSSVLAFPFALVVILAIRNSSFVICVPSGFPACALLSIVIGEFLGLNSRTRGPICVQIGANLCVDAV